MKKLTKILLIIAILLPLSGCKDNQNAKIITTINPIKNLVTSIIKDDILVQAMVDSGDYHHFEPSSNLIRKINQAQYFIYFSEKAEPFVKGILDNLNENVVCIKLASLNSQLNENDPHFWLSPQTYTILQNQLKTILTSSFELNNNYEKNNQLLNNINQEYYQQLATNKKPCIIDHDSLYYLHQDYQLPYIDVYGKNEEQEPSAKAINDIINIIKTQDIKCIYLLGTTQQHDKVLDNISKETNTSIKTLNSGLICDNIEAMLSMYQQNLEALMIR